MMRMVQVANRGNGIEMISVNELTLGDVFRRSDHDDWKTAVSATGKLSSSYLPVGYIFSDIHATPFRKDDIVYGYCMKCSENKPVTYNKDFCPKCIKEGK